MRNLITLSLTAGAVALGALAPLSAANAADMSVAPPYQPPPQAQYAPPPPAYGPPPVEEAYVYPPPPPSITRRRPSPITAMPPQLITWRRTITAAAIGAATARGLLMGTGAGIGGGEGAVRRFLHSFVGVPLSFAWWRREERENAPHSVRAEPLKNPNF